MMCDSIPSPAIVYAYLVRGLDLILHYTSNRMQRTSNICPLPPLTYQPLNYMQNIQPSCKPRPMHAPAFPSTPLDTFTCTRILSGAECLFSCVRVSSLQTYIRRTCICLSGVALHDVSHLGEGREKRGGRQGSKCSPTTREMLRFLHRCVQPLPIRCKLL